MSRFPPVFLNLLGNNLVANVTNYTVWFAITFWVFLETRSVFATGMIAGLYLVLTAGLAIWFGSLVDHHRKRLVMMGSSAASFILYALALGFLVITPEPAMRHVDGWSLWLFVGIVMLGVIAGNLRGIALPTLVTALIPEENRDRANGLVGMVSGIGFLMTSAASGLLVAWGGMEGTLAIALILTAIAFFHLFFLRAHEKLTEKAAEADTGPKKIDLGGTLKVIAAVPGLFALIFFATFNNFLGGIFMALMDAYGLSLTDVRSWGFLWAGVSTAFILSGLMVARTGLGKNPLRTLLLANLIMWSVASVFTLKSSVLLLGVGVFIWMFLGPYAEAAEQTTLQKVVPYERQGRVFGFAQSVEMAASPLTAFLIGPLTQFVVIPFMSEGGGGAAAIGDWFGTGPVRGMALVFTVAGLFGIVLTLIAWNSGYYRRLSAAYAAGPAPKGDADVQTG